MSNRRQVSMKRWIYILLPLWMLKDIYMNLVSNWYLLSCLLFIYIKYSTDQYHLTLHNLLSFLLHNYTKCDNEDVDQFIWLCCRWPETFSNSSWEDHRGRLPRGKCTNHYISFFKLFFQHLHDCFSIKNMLLS